ncbi:MAG: alanine racemase [Planctomycetota bacterium]|nr:alanine racemase [Planctomycetota bacterium]
MDAFHGTAQPQVFISRTALLHNVRLLRQSLAANVKICAMIKADAYGHASSIIADALTNWSMDQIEAPAVDALAVVTIDEALVVGRTSVPVIVLRPLESASIAHQRDALGSALHNGCTLTVATAQGAQDLARVAIAAAVRVNVQVMIDTGCAREGTPIDSLPRVLAAIESYPSLKLTGLCTHFVSSEEPGNPLSVEQLRQFTSATASYAVHNPEVLRHAANSAAVFFWPSTHLDMVRPGISLYGIDPTCRPNCQRPLRPVMKWLAPLVMIRQIKKGATVGYNQTWTAARDTRIGLVPVGYADGYWRSFSNRAKMILRGKPVPVVGRVSMDYATVDLGDAPEACVGDAATVLDNDPLSPASVYALAELAGTIPYELFCRIGARMRRAAVDPADSQENASWSIQTSTSAAKSA